ncbi:peptide MFS transporter [Peptostreptococcaceae bacterium AGR-M142]
MSVAVKKQDKQIAKKHPKGMWLICFIQAWERFSYYGMRAFLILYLTTELLRGGLGIDRAQASLIYGYFTGFVYFTPVIGGWLADKFLGKKNSIIIGGFLIAISQFLIFMGTSTTMFYIGLFILILGNGFFKPNVSSLVGDLYDKEDPRRDAAYTLLYMSVNLGAFIGPLLTGYATEVMFAQRTGSEITYYGFKHGFLIAGIAMVIGQIGFMLLYEKYLGNIETSSTNNSTNTVSQADKNRPLTKKEKDRTVVIFILTAFVVFFWAGFEQAGSSFTIYTSEYIQRDTGSFIIPVSWFQSLNPIFCVILGPIMGALWLKLAKREKGDFNIPTKMAMGIIILGFGYMFMVGAVMQRGGSEDPTVKAHMMWLIMTYFFHTVGEMCLSPIGLSMVSKLAPVKLASLLMGVWLMSSFFASIIAGYLASYVEVLGHMQIFSGIGVACITLGLILLSINKKLEKMMA